MCCAVLCCAVLDSAFMGTSGEKMSEQNLLRRDGTTQKPEGCERKRGGERMVKREGGIIALLQVLHLAAVW